MKLQWLKDIIGDDYTDELDEKVSAAIGERFVSREDFNAKAGKLTETEAQLKQLTETVAARDTQLEDLKKASGDNAELQAQIDALTQQNKDAKTAYEKELNSIKLMAAVDAELTAAGAKNNTAVKAVLAEYLENAKIVDGKVAATIGGESVTLSGKIDALKKDATTDFLFGQNSAPQYDGFKPADNGDGGKPAAGKKPSEMTYTELTEYLAANPGTKLE